MHPVTLRLPRSESQRPGLTPRSRLAVGVAAGAGAASRLLGRGGTVIGGRAALAVSPHLLAELAAGRTIAVVSGTNGKTTTTRMLHAALSAAAPTATNNGGANLASGLVTALAKDRTSKQAALEVDELVLPRVHHALSPAVTMLLNLSRDQLDRAGEVRHVADRWRAAFAGASTIVANCDDPLIAWAAGSARTVVWVAVGQPWREDSRTCPRCRSLLSSARAWRCADCGLQRPEPDLSLEDDGDRPGRIARIGKIQRPLPLALPGRANEANALMALAAAQVLGVAIDPALAAIAGVAGVDGRYATVNHAGHEVRLLLAKNPAGWVEAIDQAAPERPAVLAINARTADGRDPSWLYDAPLERLAGRTVVATGERAADLAVRLRYAGISHVIEPEPLKALDRAGEATPGGPIDVLANYTAFQTFRARLGHAD